MAEKEEEEMMWLAKGDPLKLEEIKKYTTREYLSLLKYTVENLPKNK